MNDQGFHVEIYRSGVIFRGYRWRVRAANGAIVAAASETYDSHAYTLEMVGRLFPHLPIEDSGLDS